MCQGSTVPAFDLVATALPLCSAVSGGAFTRVEVPACYTGWLDEALHPGQPTVRSCGTSQWVNTVAVPSHRLAPRDSVSEVSEHFRYAIDKRYLPVLLPFLLRPARDGVTLTDEGSLVATFGLFNMVTPRSNISGAHITRNYRWWTACGVRMSRVDDGLTFGTNHEAGVCIHFAERVPSRLRRTGHSALTVTVADLDGLTTALGGG
jgi:hypothetical protein